MSAIAMRPFYFRCIRTGRRIEENRRVREEVSQALDPLAAGDQGTA